MVQNELLHSVQSMDQLEKKELRDLFNMESHDAFHLASIANQSCEAVHGKQVTYVVNRNINFTNVCRFNCRFCGFHVDCNDPGGYFLTNDDVREKVLEAKQLEPACTEICIQGGIHPDLTIEVIEGYLQAIKEVEPTLHIHGFSPQEIWNLSKVEKSSVEEVLDRLKVAGLGSVPGTAAEILVDGVRKRICPSKIPTNRWIDIIKMIHRAGLPSTATIMYGHVETIEDIIKHLEIVRGIQKKTGGFTEFVPLPFQNEGDINEGLKRIVKPPDGLLDLKMHAIARLFFKDCIPNIQCSWVKLGVKFCQVLVNSGANDFSGTLMEENITRSAGGRHGQYFPSRSMVRAILTAGKIPVQRTTIYELF
ncbi:7,8-didemethyl-8-hydroxy-5-deazariboflavin synthase subunit CofH [Candidatus Bathyarchaeota archaeon]|nr:7,8-didemethyl-8-hydroxy-5-deazariboflavin synthase subunit CofH [Candidatus Bathyarchaeota archaeon]